MFFRRNFAARTRDRETECCYLQNNIGSNSTKTQRFIYLYPTAFIKCNFARTRYCICSSHTRCWIYSIVNLYLFIYFACTRTDVGFSFFFFFFFSPFLLLFPVAVFLSSAARLHKIWASSGFSAQLFRWGWVIHHCQIRAAQLLAYGRQRVPGSNTYLGVIYLKLN